MHQEFNLTRRQFNRNVIAGLAGLGFLTGCSKRMGDFTQLAEPITLPPKLRSGQRIGLIAPASYADEDKIAKAILNIQSFDLDL